jgi:hypothetical protein
MIQAVILLAIALAVAVGLWAMHDKSRALGRSPRGGPDAAGVPTAPATLAAPPGGVSRPALPPDAERARRRLDELPATPLMRDVAALVYHDTDAPEFAALIARFDAWNVQFFEVPQTGTKIAVLKAKDPNDHRVLVGLGGTEGPDPRHWAVNFGQHLPPETTAEALGKVGLAAAAGSVAGVAVETAKFAMSTLAWGEYKGLQQLGATLKARYGAENVLLAGHSKGGGAATFMGATNGLRTYTFNAAGMSEVSRELIRRAGVANPERFVTNVVADGEVLSRADVGTKLGEVITVEGGGSGRWSSIENHKLDNILIDKPVRYQPAQPLSR